MTSESEGPRDPIADVLRAAVAWIGDPAKGFGSHREHDLAAAVTAYQKWLSEPRAEWCPLSGGFVRLDLGILQAYAGWGILNRDRYVARTSSGEHRSGFESMDDAKRWAEETILAGLREAMRRMLDP